MCGIAGILSKNPEFMFQDRIKAMTDVIAHRGPEGEAFYINTDSTVALGHRRLSIIDLSDDAAQPMQYANRHRIIHNGELYNYIELRSELKKKGYTFTTESDTEVIVAAYDAYGTNCLQHFDGMFAFAIWDEKDQILFAARDRFGEKPFYYFVDEQQLVFASEMKAFWKAGIAKDVNKAMLYNFLTIGYTGNPFDPSETFYQQIQKLPAASYLTFALPAHELTITKYWQLGVNENTDVSDEEAVEQFNSLLSQSVRKRLRSDVAIGTSLSGGLDSSAIVAKCAQHSSQQYTYKCFTASFTNFEKNELQFASKVAKQYNLQHHIVEVSADDVITSMNTVMHHQEEPIGSASGLAQFKVYEAAKRNGVTVLLDGQGADEIIGGYHKFFKWHWQELYQNKKLAKSGELKAAKKLGNQENFGLKNKTAALLPEFAAGILQTRKAKKAFRHPYLNSDFAFSNKRNLYYATPTHFTLNGALFFDTVIYGLEELLKIADRNSMAHATEVRLPYLNHHLVEFIFSLPAHFKIRNGWTKWLLRSSLDESLPDEITWRRDKVGFEPPQKVWMTDKRIQEAIQEGKKKLVSEHILKAEIINKKIQPQDAIAADNFDWRYWVCSYLYH